MNIEELRDDCIRRAGVTEEFPFDKDTLVFKVAGKMFILISISNPVRFNAKCDPERAAELREQFPDDILPGYHMSKKNWNTITMNGSVPDKLQRELIAHSYEEVVKGLPKKVRETLL